MRKIVDSIHWIHLAVFQKITKFYTSQILVHSMSNLREYLRYFKVFFSTLAHSHSLHCQYRTNGSIVPDGYAECSMRQRNRYLFYQLKAHALSWTLTMTTGDVCKHFKAGTNIRWLSFCCSGSIVTDVVLFKLDEYVKNKLQNLTVNQKVKPFIPHTFLTRTQRISFNFSAFLNRKTPEQSLNRVSVS